MRKRKPQEQVKLYAREILKELSRYKEILENGCNDPNWSDGANLLLIRNHVLYYKREIEQICKDNSLDLPPEYYYPTPAEQDKNYMANKNTERFKKLNGMVFYNGKLTTRKVKYDDCQMSL